VADGATFDVTPNGILDIDDLITLGSLPQPDDDCYDDDVEINDLASLVSATGLFDLDEDDKINVKKCTCDEHLCNGGPGLAAPSVAFAAALVFLSKSF